MSTSWQDTDRMEGRVDVPGATDGFDLLLKNDRGAAFAARQVVLAGNGLVPAAVRDEVLLLVSELVTNALRHAGMGSDQLLRVELRRWSGLVRLAVVDEGNGFTPDPEHFGRDESGGWGLFLVDRIADRWGVVPEAAGTRVWFEIKLDK
jgi:anti-sigma regulatory factor (Ser/Thr protein kinase)